MNIYLKLIVTNTINICLFLCYSCPFLMITFLNVSIVATPIDTIFNFFWMAYQFIWICLCFRVPRIVNFIWNPTTTGKLQLRNQTVNHHCYLIDLLSVTIITHLWLKMWETYCILLLYLFIARTINIFYVIDHKLKLYVEETHFSKFHNFYPNGLLHMFDSC